MKSPRGTCELSNIIQSDDLNIEKPKNDPDLFLFYYGLGSGLLGEFP